MLTACSVVRRLLPVCSFELCRRIFGATRAVSPFDVVAQQLCAGYIFSSFGDVLHFSDARFGVLSLARVRPPQPSRSIAT